MTDLKRFEYVPALSECLNFYIIKQVDSKRDVAVIYRKDKYESIIDDLCK